MQFPSCLARYKPATAELDSKLKAFIPDYIPAVGEVDAYLKIPRPDNKDEPLGLQILVCGCFFSLIYLPLS